MKKPYLLQRGKSEAFKDSMLSSEYLRLDYMGSAEFEFGALPQFQREVFAKADALEVFACHHRGTTLYFMVEPGQEKEYSQFVRDLIEDKLRLKERSGLQDREDYRDTKSPFRFDVWWDIDNAVAIARHPEILKNLKVTVCNSVQFMNRQKGATR